MIIDSHAHLAWYFNRQGRLHQRGDGDTPVQSMLAMAANAYATLMSGVTECSAAPHRDEATRKPRVRND